RRGAPRRDQRRARALRDDQATLRRRDPAHRRGRHADIVAEAAPEGRLRPAPQPLRGALRMKEPKRSPMDSIAALVTRLRRGPKALPAVGETPHSVVWAENKWRLLRFGNRPRFATPVLLVPSLINRWYILDLGPGRSLIEWLVAQGHDVYCIDWGT